MRILHVVAGLEPNQGGPAYTVPKLCEAVAAGGNDVALYSVASQSESVRAVRHGVMEKVLHRWDGARIPFVGALRKSAALSRNVRNMGERFDVCHVHGLWTWPTVVAAEAASRNGIPLILAPRGMLSPGSLRISSRKKKLFWKLFHSRSLRGLSCLHATSDLEAEELRGFSEKHGLEVPIAVVPNGIDIFDLPPRAPTARTILSLGRIHPKKGLDGLIRAWARIAATRPDWDVKIVGPDEGNHSVGLRRLADELRVPRVSIEGPRYGNEKIEAYRNAALFVLPSHAENFGVTVAEALVAETPVIATRNTPWQALEAEKCGWWIEGGVESLAHALQKATALPPETLARMGANGRAYVSRAFRWDVIGQQMIGVYEWLGGRGEMPECVALPDEGALTQNASAAAHNSTIGSEIRM